MTEPWTIEEEARRLHARFDQLKAATGLGQAEFARLYAVPGGASMVSQHIKNRRPINLAAARAYARGFQVSLDQISPRLAEEVRQSTSVLPPTNVGYSKTSSLMEVRNGLQIPDAQSNVEDAPALKENRLVPVVGEVKGGDDGFLEELQYPVGHGEGSVDYPTSDSLAYALRVRGDSMHPRYRAGEFIVVTPSVEAQPSDDVVVALKDGRKLLKVLNWIQDGEIQLLSVNNHFGPLTLQLTEVEFVHLVDGRVRRSAFHRG